MGSPCINKISCRLFGDENFRSSHSPTSRHTYRTKWLRLGVNSGKESTTNRCVLSLSCALHLPQPRFVNLREDNPAVFQHKRSTVTGVQQSYISRSHFYPPAEKTKPSWMKEGLVQSPKFAPAASLRVRFRYFLKRRRAAPAAPSRPVPNKSILVGSGTTVPP